MNYEIAYRVNYGIYYFLRILEIAMVAYGILSWIARPDNRLYVFLRNLVWPLLVPFRPLSAKLIEKGLRIDLSLFFALIAIEILQNLLPRLVFALFGL